MKQKTTYHLLFILLCLTACSSTKRSTLVTHRQTILAEQLTSDSLTKQQLRRQLQQRNIVLRHIRLTLPDTLGRQALQSVTEITVEETSNLRDSVTEKQIHQETRQIATQTENTSETQKTIERKSPWWNPLLWIVAFTGLLLTFFRKRH